MLTQATKASVASTKDKEHEPSTKDTPLETINVNSCVNDQARENVLPQGGDVVVPLPPKDDIVQPQAGELAEEVPAKVAEEVPTNAMGGVKDSEVGPSEKRVGDSDSEDESLEFVIPLEDRPVKDMKDNSPLMSSIIIHVDYKLIHEFLALVDEV
ncbi:hypothetical protein K7X08_032684 [Anisodus acutangulus]|uniref:Uncharacterized protein n=1 Tax=Anisodus acutangulus TaxID=402998 RepID=A0A9Q1RR50_9SOLA|nr:hypothetical protein K7X08_032684 [Anisodus acutangulus]